MTLQPDPSLLIQKLMIHYPLIGLYDAPDPTPFEPMIQPYLPVRRCLFSSFKYWQEGKTLHLTAENFGCGGCGYWLFGISHRSREAFVRFLVETEGLKASHELMNQWLDHKRPYQPKHSHLLVGPLRENQYQYLRSVTFFVNPDQLSTLMIGAQYHTAPEDPPPVIAPFGSGCSQLVPQNLNENISQAMIGATDLAMRKHLPPEVLAFTVTKPMFAQLCELAGDERSYLYKSFFTDLKKARNSVDRD